MAKLTDKQTAFVREYLVDLNATQAAIRAGYSERTASRIGPQLLGKTCVREAIEKAQAKRARRVEIKAEDVLRGVIEVTTQARDSGDLKTALKGGVLFDVFAVFVKGGGADDLKIASCKGRL